jgi:hypothetical protein
VKSNQIRFRSRSWAPYPFKPLLTEAKDNPSVHPTMPVSAATHFHMSPAADNDQLIFGPIDLDPQLHWDPSFADIEPDFKSNSYSFSALSNYEFGPPGNVFFDTYSPPIEDLSTWINDSELTAPFTNTDDAFAVPHPLPRSLSPTSSFDDTTTMRPRVRSVISPCEVSLQAPSWATQLWESTSPSSPTSSPLRTLSRPSIRHSPLTTDATVRQQRIPIRRSSLSLSSMHLFHSASAPTTHAESSSSPVMTRSYTTKNSDSVGVVEDRDATVRSSRRKRTPESDTSAVTINPASYAGMNSKKDIPRTFPFSLFFGFISYLLRANNALFFSLHFSAQIVVASTKASALGLAAVFYRLDPKAASFGNSQAQCCPGG